jgi:hypothetical protein
MIEKSKSSNGLLVLKDTITLLIKKYLPVAEKVQEINSIVKKYVFDPTGGNNAMLF